MPNKDALEIVNLKTPITFRLDLSQERSGKKMVAFTTKTFRGKRSGRGTNPERNELVPFYVTDIVIDSSDPWFTLQDTVLVQVLWSNVISVQHET